MPPQSGHDPQQVEKHCPKGCEVVSHHDFDSYFLITSSLDSPHELVSHLYIFFGETCSQIFYLFLLIFCLCGGVYMFVGTDIYAHKCIHTCGGQSVLPHFEHPSSKDRLSHKT